MSYESIRAALTTEQQDELLRMFEQARLSGERRLPPQPVATTGLAAIVPPPAQESPEASMRSMSVPLPHASLPLDPLPQPPPDPRPQAPPLSASLPESRISDMIEQARISTMIEQSRAASVASEAMIRAQEANRAKVIEDARIYEQVRVAANARIKAANEMVRRVDPSKAIRSEPFVEQYKISVWSTVMRRLSEPKTYTALIGLATLVGLTQTQYQAYALAAAGVFTFLATFLPEVGAVDEKRS